MAHPSADLATVGEPQLQASSLTYRLVIEHSFGKAYCFIGKSSMCHFGYLQLPEGLRGYLGSWLEITDREGIDHVYTMLMSKSTFSVASEKKDKKSRGRWNISGQ